MAKRKVLKITPVLVLLNILIIIILMKKKGKNSNEKGYDYKKHIRG